MAPWVPPANPNEFPNQRRSIRQEEQDGDEYRYPDHNPDYKGGRVDR